MGLTTTNAVLVEKDEVNTDQVAIRLALFDGEGTPVKVPTSQGDLPIDVITVSGLIGTAAKTSTSNAPTPGTLVPLKFTSGNSAASPTVAFNGGAAKAVLLGGSAPDSGEITLAANGVALFFYDGTNLHQVGVYS